MTLELKSKAQTLEELRPVIQSASVLPVYRFFAQDYQKNKSSMVTNFPFKIYIWQVLKDLVTLSTV